VTPVVRTVLGDVDPADLGIVLPHEHVVMDSRPLLAVHGYVPAAQTRQWDVTLASEARWNPGVHPSNYDLTDEDAAVEELAPFVAAGGRTVVDLTPPTLGRAPEALARIARRAGVHVVSGVGQYLAPVHEPWVARVTEDELAARLVAAATDGPIRAGIFGEIGTSDPVRPEERRVLRAVARSSRETGLAISVHLHPWGHEGPAVLDELTRAGADPVRVILGHVTTAIDRPDELRAMADRGATLGFDLFGFDHSLLGPGRWPPSDVDVVGVVACLVREGRGERIVLSQDVGVRTRLRRWGGWGYAHLLEHVVPLLRAAGVTGDEVRAMLVANPARLLTVAAGVAG
jgi:phosphotriesterase-related protein